MAYSITQPSYTLYPTDNLSWSTASSTDYTQSAFVYRFAVQVGTTSSNLATVSTNRVPVTPGSTAASFAPNAILRNYVTTPVNFNSAGGTASTEGFKFGRVIYGQEYNTNGTVIGSTGATGTTFRFWNSIFSYAEWPSYNADQWVIGATSSGVKFLTDGPSSRCLIPNDLLYINVGGQDPTYTKEEIFPANTWNWPTYSGYSDFFDIYDNSGNTLGYDLVWIGGATGFTISGWPVPGITGFTGVYAREMPVLVSSGSTITIKIENSLAYGSTTTNYPRLELVGSTGASGPWTRIGYIDTTQTILPSANTGDFSGTSNGNYTYLGIRMQVDTTGRLGVPTIAGGVTTWTFVNNEVYYWNIDYGATASKFAMSIGQQNWINVPQAASDRPCTVYVTDVLDTVLSETITYVECDDCTACEKKSLTWLNSKGGYDTYQFYCVNSRSIEAARYNGQQTLAQNYAVGDRGLYNIANVGRLKTRVNTDYVLPDQVDWLESLFISPSVYEVAADGTLTPVVIDNTTYVRYAKPNKLMVVEFEYTEANLRTSQIR